MKATDLLKHEHNIVLAVLDGAEREARNIQATGKVNTDKVAKLVHFFLIFVEKWHHSKEKNLLFPRLQQCGMPIDSGPIAVILQKQALGRDQVVLIAKALCQYKMGASQATAPLVEHLLSLTAQLREHISRENEGLFVVADQILSPVDQEELCDAFEAIKSSEIANGKHEQYHKYAHELLSY